MNKKLLCVVLWALSALACSDATPDAAEAVEAPAAALAAAEEAPAAAEAASAGPAAAAAEAAAAAQGEATAQAQPAVEPAATPNPGASKPTGEPAQAAAKPETKPAEAAQQPVADTAKTAAAAVATPCGEDDQPSCPLQDFMEKNLDPDLDNGNLERLATALTRVATLAPDPSWNTGDNAWSSISRAGADAAKSGDLDGAKQSCKTCHRTWRKKYKAEFRTRPLPL